MFLEILSHHGMDSYRFFPVRIFCLFKTRVNNKKIWKMRGVTCINSGLHSTHHPTVSGT